MLWGCDSCNFDLCFSCINKCCGLIIGIFQNIINEPNNESYLNIDYTNIVKICGGDNHSFLIKYLCNKGFDESQNGEGLKYDINQIETLKLHFIIQCCNKLKYFLHCFSVTNIITNLASIRYHPIDQCFWVCYL